MSNLIELRLAYWREIITNTPCPDRLCGAKAGESCAGGYDPVVHLERLRAWTHRPLAVTGGSHAV